jgi:hypothetical protein
VAGKNSGTNLGYTDQAKVGFSLGVWNHSSLASPATCVPDLSFSRNSIFVGDTTLCQLNAHLIRGNEVLDKFENLIENITNGLYL